MHHESPCSPRVAVAIALAFSTLFTTAIAGAEETPPPQSSEPATREKPATRDKDEDRSEPFRIGALAGIGFPRPLNFEAMVKLDRRVGIGVEYGLLPHTTIGGVDTEMHAITADLRVFPFANAFFIGMAAGQQHFSATATATYDGFSATESISGDSWFINPRIGVLQTFDWGLTIGIDAGLQIPLSATFTSTIPDGIPNVSQPTTDTAHLLGKHVIPTIDALRVGFLF